jgi:hypothetical protein
LHDILRIVLVAEEIAGERLRISQVRPDELLDTLERQRRHYVPTSNGDCVTGDVGQLAARQGH